MADDEEFVAFEVECRRRVVAGTIARCDGQGRVVSEHVWFEGDPPPVIGPDGEVVVNSRESNLNLSPRQLRYMVRELIRRLSESGWLRRPEDEGDSHQLRAV